MFDKEFKIAIQELPNTEKDKLIFRLLKKDLDLANRLHFELVSTETVEDRRTRFEIEMLKAIGHISQRYHSVGYLLQNIRYVSGDISEHVRITKDKFGEISLNIKMLNKLLVSNTTRIENADYSKSYKMCIYIVARVFKIMLLIQAIDEDYFIDFKEDFKTLGELIERNPSIMEIATNNSLDVNCLLLGEIPTNLVAIHKELRQNGYLK